MVVRITPEKVVTVLAERFKDGRFNSPNDCTIARDGTIYFTDPSYGLGDRPREQPCEGVYRISARGEITRVVDDMTRPNGLGISADSARKAIRAYAIAQDGGVSDGRDFASLESENEGVPDGMTLDEEGNVYCAAGGGVWVFSPAGEHIGTIETPEVPANCTFEVPANCTFGGSDLKTLYITARTSVYRIGLNIKGLKWTKER